MTTIQWVKNYTDLSIQAANIVEQCVHSHARVNFGCPTGYTPIGMYHELVKRNIDWDRVTTFNLDEYCGLPVGHRGSYKHYMDTHLHWHVNINSAYYPAPDYDSLISRYGGLHVTVLGLGMNGHIAFNEPGSEIDSGSRVVELSLSTMQTNSKTWEWDIPFPLHAFTMGMKTILASRSILLLVTGTHKLEILKRALWGPITSSCPASFLQQHPQVTVLYCE